MTDEPKKLEWKVNLPNLLNEILLNKGTEILHRPLQITGDILYAVGARAAELDDPVLNHLMCRLAIYEVADQYGEGYDREAVIQVEKAALKMQDETAVTIRGNHKGNYQMIKLPIDEPITGDQVRTAMIAANITEVDHHACGFCGYMTRFVLTRVQDLDSGQMSTDPAHVCIAFDPGCNCTTSSAVLEPRSFDDAAQWINMHCDKTFKQRIAAKFGITLTEDTSGGIEQHKRLKAMSVEAQQDLLSSFPTSTEE